ncbi:MAG: response regulator [Synergistaceae bacterium]|nr:response regulator [Synergistaceae bacterium]MBR0253273.1 response regulator [Synergistaceae bacterium]
MNMKEKILYISDRPSMGADMLIKSLDGTFEISKIRSTDEFNYVPKIILVNLAGLEALDKIKTLTNTKIFLLGTQIEINNSKFQGSEYFIKPFNAKEIKEKLLNLSQSSNEIQRSILLVDDDSVMIRTLRDGLSTSYKVLPANSGANALKILERGQKPDLILLDYEMPEMNGTQVFEILKSSPELSKIPVMFLTAKTDSDSIEKIEELKPEGHLLKTLPLKEIKERLRIFFDMYN